MSLAFKSSGMLKPPTYLLRYTKTGEAKLAKNFEEMVLYGSSLYTLGPSDWEIIPRPSFLLWAKRTRAFEESK